MSKQQQGSRVVFVGNIPYDVTEERLTEIFSAPGPVVHFRLLFDRETGKPKGFGFCEYKDVNTALSAIRNLNNYDINGRKLRVAYAENEGRDNLPGSNAGPDGAGGVKAGGIPAHPMLTQGVTGNMAAEVNRLLQEMSTQHLYEMMVHMKALIQQNPEQARQILVQNPQVSYALLQAQVVLGYLSPEVAQRLLTAAKPSPAPAPAMPPVMPLGAPMQLPPHGIPPVGPHGGFPPAPVNPFITGGGPPPVGPGGYPHQPPGFGQPMMPPHILPPAPGPQWIPLGIPPNAVDALPLPLEQKNIMRTVLAMTPQQFDTLQPQERVQILQIRGALLALFPPRPT